MLFEIVLFLKTLINVEDNGDLTIKINKMSLQHFYL